MIEVETLHTGLPSHTQLAGKEEYELTGMKTENMGSTVRIFVVGDLETGVAYAVKV